MQHCIVTIAVMFRQSINFSSLTAVSSDADLPSFVLLYRVRPSVGRSVAVSIQLTTVDRTSREAGIDRTVFRSPVVRIIHLMYCCLSTVIAKARDRRAGLSGRVARPDNPAGQPGCHFDTRFTRPGSTAG